MNVLYYNYARDAGNVIDECLKYAIRLLVMISHFEKGDDEVLKNGTVDFVSFS